MKLTELFKTLSETTGHTCTACGQLYKFRYDADQARICVTHDCPSAADVNVCQDVDPAQVENDLVG